MHLLVTARCPHLVTGKRHPIETEFVNAYAWENSNSVRMRSQGVGLDESSFFFPPCLWCVRHPSFRSAPCICGRVRQHDLYDFNIDLNAVNLECFIQANWDCQCSKFFGFTTKNGLLIRSVSFIVDTITNIILYDIKIFDHWHLKQDPKKP